MGEYLEYSQVWTGSCSDDGTRSETNSFIIQQLHWDGTPNDHAISATASQINKSFLKR